MKNVLKEVVAALGVSNREFCLTCGLSESFTRNTVNPTLQNLRKILATYPNINPNFIFYGEDPIFLPKGTKTSEVAESSEPAYGRQSDCRDLAEENRQLRKENQELRTLLIEQMRNNSQLMSEALQALTAQVAKPPFSCPDAG